MYAGKTNRTDAELLRLIADSFSEKIAGAFNATGDFTTPDAEMLDRLTRNVWHFTGAKNYQNLRDLTLALKDENGKLREFSEWKKEAQQICDTYNVKWMRTEYNMAVAGSQNAARWVEFKREAHIIPMLQYQTVGDDNVRDSHRVLDGITKHIDDTFWRTHYPPNGYGCRCEAIQSVGGEETPEKEMPQVAIPMMFRTNLAETGLIFPSKHPFYNGIPADIKQDYNKRVCRNIDRIWLDWVKKHIPEGEQQRVLANIESGVLVITRNSAKDVLNHIANADNKHLVNRLFNNVDKLKFIQSKPLDATKENYQKKQARGVVKYNYYEVVLESKTWYVNTEVNVKGYEKLYAFEFKQ